MNPSWLSVQWAARRQLGDWIKVQGETAAGEPHVSVDGDQLVLRRVDGKFWPAERCQRCGKHLAAPDLEAHSARCREDSDTGADRGADDGEIPLPHVSPTDAPPYDSPRRLQSSSEQNSDGASVPEAGRHGVPKPPRATGELIAAPTGRSRDGADSVEGADGGTAVGGRASLRWVTVALAVVLTSGVVAVLLIRPSSSRGASRPGVPGQGSPPTASAAPAIEPAPTSTAVATPPPSAVSLPPTTTTVPSPGGRQRTLSLAEQLAFQQSSIDRRRVSLIEQLVKDAGPQLITSVDRLEFDASRPRILIEATSPATLTPSLYEAAWSLTRSALVLWEPSTVREIPNSVPRLRIRVNALQLECSADVMVRLGYGDASRDTWASDCQRVT